jgi:hypothetical protein
MLLGFDQRARFAQIVDEMDAIGHIPEATTVWFEV